MTSKPVPPNLISKINRPTLNVKHFFRIVTRPGSLDVLRNPSNIGGKLYYPEINLDRTQVKP